MKRFSSILLAALLLLVCAPAVTQAADIEIIIHYQRADGDYEKWNIWSWPAGKDGKAYPFNGEDGFGAVAVYTLPGGGTSVGFIVRTDSWEKDPGDGDRFIDLSLGSEIWVWSGSWDYTYEAPEGFGSTVEYDELEIVIHRNRYDGDYERDAARLTLDGGEVPLTKTGGDDFGDIYKAVLYNVGGRQKPALDFGGGEPLEISLSKLPEDAVGLEVYSVQGKSRLFGGREEAGIDKYVAEARVDGPETMYVRLSYPVENSEANVAAAFGNAVFDSSGAPMRVSCSGYIGAPDLVYTEMEGRYVTQFDLTVIDGLFLPGETYAVSFEGYEAAESVFSSRYFSSEGFDRMYSYSGVLGAVYTEEKTDFRLWAPTAAEAYVNLYPSGHGSERTERLAMFVDEDGIWRAIKTGDLDGVYYTYTVLVNGEENEAIDPYAVAAGVNGARGMVADLAKTNPQGWENDVSPPFEHPVDAIIYELHIRDFSVAPSSGMENKGKYLAFTETGTVNPNGLATGIDHLAELGITHVHLLPSFDFRSIDERYLEDNNFNWGYDPENYNLPEGSYSTDPYNGHTRIAEFKRMVQSLHQNGIRVVMDVVYNHTGASSESNLNKLVPGYYYRMNEDGSFSNGSGCGNETASERAMVRKLIIDSVVYWASEYHIDGFRFDLMGLHDIETMNLVRAALDGIDPTILLYGEGWTGGGTTLPENEQALKANTPMLDERIAAFSDDVRDGIKGHVFNAEQPGFVNGDFSKREDVMFGVTASVYHPQIDYSRVSYSSAPWAKAPSQTITYASAHDNLTLWDKFKATRPELKEAEWLKMNKLSALLVFTSQGIPFIQAGEEFARTKYGDHNSFQSSDAVNRLEWTRKSDYSELTGYYKGLIELRKEYPAFRLRTAGEIAEAITFLPTETEVLAYTLTTPDGILLVAVNADSAERSLALPAEGWDILADGERAGTAVLGSIGGDRLTLPPRAGFVLAQRMGAGSETPGNGETEGEAEKEPGKGVPFWVWASLGALAAAGAAVWVIYRRKG